MDYIFASALRHHSLKLSKVGSYDIACQWAVHLLERIKRLPPLVRLHIIFSLTFVIPKLHIYGHKLRCQLNYSFHLHPGVGNTDGEGIERSHSFIGPMGTATREMGPGSRHDTLDDGWGYWNWLKLVSLRTFLRYSLTYTNSILIIAHILQKRLGVAVEECRLQRESFDVFTGQQAEHVRDWKEAIVKWEATHEGNNPYNLPLDGKFPRILCATLQSNFYCVYRSN